MRDCRAPSFSNVDRRQISERSDKLQPGARHEVLCTADPAELIPVDGVGDDLTVDVDRERAVDGDHVAVGADHVRRVDDLDGQERDGLVAV
jgi:hypothetical protein